MKSKGGDRAVLLIGRIKRLNPRLLTLAETGALVEEVSLPIKPEIYTRLLAVIQNKCPYVLVDADPKGYVVDFVASDSRHWLVAELRRQIEEAIVKAEGKNSEGGVGGYG